MDTSDLVPLQTTFHATQTTDDDGWIVLIAAPATPRALRLHGYCLEHIGTTPPQEIGLRWSVQGGAATQIRDHSLLFASGGGAANNSPVRVPFQSRFIQGPPGASLQYKQLDAPPWPGGANPHTGSPNMRISADYSVG